MNLQVAYRPYCREFLSPLQTAHGEWKERAGFIVRVASGSAVGYGEVAPLPEFGTETWARADDFLRQWVADAIIMPSGLPCCSFALTSAIQNMRGSAGVLPRDYAVAALLPAGSEALVVAQEKLAAGYTAFKWKIGVLASEVEQKILKELLVLLPETVSLRLDANGGFNSNQLQSWLGVLEPHAGQVEFLEQPLPPGEEASMAALARDYGIPIALDESLNGPGRERWLMPGAWAGPLVIKPLLMGNVTVLQERLRPLSRQIVFSSVFETGIGLWQALRLADTLPAMKYAIGFDTLAAFDDDLSKLAPGPSFRADERANFDPELIWKQLPPLT